MLSRLTGAHQSEKASQEQVSDKAAAGVTALAKLVQIIGKHCGTQVKAVAAGYRQLALILPWDCSPWQISAVNVSTTTRYMQSVAGACAGSQEFGCTFR